jgi:hypothetical protein
VATLDHHVHSSEQHERLVSEKELHGNMAQAIMKPTTQQYLSSAPTIPLAPQEMTEGPQGESHLVMIVPHEEGERQAQAMETWFQACASDEPFALELVGTRREQGFVLRASSEAQLTLLSKQFEAQYPQAELHRIAPSADPLLVHSGEVAVVGEFALARASWMPLKTFSGRVLAEPGSDPLAGILAAMEPLGSGQRIICQLALVRAPDSWIAPDIRKAVEHPLQEERDALFTAQKGIQHNADGEGDLCALAIVMALLVLLGYRWYLAHAWLPIALLVAALIAGGVGWLWWKFSHARAAIYDMKLVAEKLMRQAFYCQLRVVVIGKAPPRSHEEQKCRAGITPKERARAEQADRGQLEEQLRVHLLRLEVAYRQLSLASANSLFLKRVRHLEETSKQASGLTSAAHAFTYRHALLRLLHSGAWSRDVWNALELSGAFHLPQEMAEVPLVKRLAVKHLLASPEIANRIKYTRGPLPPALIGYSQHRGYRVPVYLPFATLFSHTFLAARSRYGKSTLMQLLLWATMQEVRDGSPQPGIFCIDPHRDLIEDALALIALLPSHRARDVLLLDMTDDQFPVAVNPLDASMGFTRDQAVANLMSSFERIWSDFWGPRMAYFLRNVCLLLYTLNERLVQEGRADQQFTLLDINPLLQYEDYATLVLNQLDMSETWHQELLAWWQNTYFTLPRNCSFRQEVILPILSKLGVFHDNQQLRRIVGQPVTRAPIHEAVTQGRIVLCALSSRDMDDASVNILGSTLINLLRRSFRLQVAVPFQQRRKVFLAIDEFQAFSGADIGKLLSEDSKFGCATLLATQFLKQLNTFREGLLDTVLGNCENLCAFNVSASDAKILEEELQKKVSQKHIISQPRLHCYARLAIPDEPLQIVSVALARPLSWQRTSSQHAQIQAMRSHNQRRFLPVSEVDRLHEAHLKRFLDVGLFAAKIRREAKAMAENKQRREDAVRLEEHVREDAQQTTRQNGDGNAGATSPASSSLNQSGTVQEETGGQAGDASTNTSANPSQGQGGRRGKHHRSRRLGKLKKTPVGAPPPELTGEELLDAGESARPLLFPSGIGREYSGRERERA